MQYTLGNMTDGIGQSTDTGREFKSEFDDARKRAVSRVTEMMDELEKLQDVIAQVPWADFNSEDNDIQSMIESMDNSKNELNDDVQDMRDHDEVAYAEQLEVEEHGRETERKDLEKDVAETEKESEEPEEEEKVEPEEEW